MQIIMATARISFFPKTQLDSFTGLPLSRDRLARCFRGELGNVKGKRVLEAGSGAGRFTEVLLAEGAILDSFDYSEAVEANWANNASPNLTLVQADIRDIPFPKASYDYVVCLGVIQHTPDSDESITKLFEMVKPGGALVIDHYRWTRWQLPPPVGGAGRLWRLLFLSLPREKRWPAVKRFVDFWFPVYWRFRDNTLMRKILPRIGEINFYYPRLGLSKKAYYEWTLLDTHDATTDYYRHYRSPEQIHSLLTKLGATDIHSWVGGNGTEAFCRKPAD